MNGHLLLHHLGRLARITAISYQLARGINEVLHGIGDAYSKSRMKRQHELRRMTSNRMGCDSEPGWSDGVYFSWKSII